MKLITEGNISKYYLQTLCLLFFPGAKFSESETMTEMTPVLFVRLSRKENIAIADATLTVGTRATDGAYSLAYSEDFTNEKIEQIAIGRAVFEACSRFFSYTPTWGILTGVRPAKVAADLLLRGNTADAVQSFLEKQYLVSPKKASLVTEIAIHERQIIPRYGKDTCSLYISIPFCPTRCAYCSFVSYTSKKLLNLIPDYLSALLEEIDLTLRMIRALGLHLSTVYIGGGTPTTLNEAQLSRLLSFIAQRCNVSDLEEFTLEAGRPDTVTAEKLHIAKQCGVTRVSINPQTLDDAILQRIGRNHTTSQFFAAYETAKNAGIPYINTDLIAGLPGDSFDGFSKTFDQITRLAPQNITVHTFCIKRSAELKTQNVYRAEDAETEKGVDYARDAAYREGYLPYYIYRQKNTAGNLENVGYCIPGAEGLYNILMMEEVHSVFAVGAGAVTKLVGPDGAKIERLSNPKYPYEYLQEDRPAAFAAREEAVSRFYREYFRLSNEKGNL